MYATMMVAMKMMIIIIIDILKWPKQ